jgi:predicted nucleotidyltransferase component of viral defense system
MKDNEMRYLKQVELLLDLIPTIAQDEDFALKGGTAINLFIKDMPRLSVDLDLVYLPLNDRDTTLFSIDEKLRALMGVVQKRHPYLKVTPNPSTPGCSRQLICKTIETQVKVEVNIIIRGTLYPVEIKSVSKSVQDTFKRDVAMQVVSYADVYGSKICAALDRQHPRDLFDMMIFFTDNEITRDIFNGFIFYLLSHNRPIAEVINPTLLDISDIYEKDFVGMSKENIRLDQLLDARTQLIQSLHQSFLPKDIEFLKSFKAGHPDWSLFDMPSLQNYPSIQWKLKNVQAMSPAKRQESLHKLSLLLDRLTIQ